MAAHAEFIHKKNCLQIALKAVGADNIRPDLFHFR